MHICVIFYNFGGYHLARLQTARQACAARGWKFSAIQIAGTTAEHPWGTIELPEDVVTLLPFQHGATPTLDNVSLLTDVLNETHPDVVAIPGWGFNFSRVALAWCRRYNRVPILMSESKHDDAPRKWWKELIKKWFVVRHFRTAIVGGQKHRGYLRQLGIPDEAIFGGYDVVDNHNFCRRVDQLRSQDSDIDVPVVIRGRRSFLAASRFIPRKNLARLILAFREILNHNQDRYRDWDLVLLGGGSEEGNLKALADSLGLLGRVHFPGFQTYDEVSKWYAFSDVFVHPALSEQWGLVVNEAMAAELPILLSNACGCYPDLLHEGLNGFSFAPEGIDNLAQKMTRLADDHALRQRMGRESRKIIQTDFSPEAFGAGLLQAADYAMRVQQDSAKSTKPHQN